MTLSLLDSRLQLFVEVLTEILDTPQDQLDEHDAIHAAAAGERLRRALQLDDKAPEARRCLQRYMHLLETKALSFTIDLGKEIELAIAALETAITSGREDLEGCLSSLDDLMCVAVAGLRCGQFPESEVERWAQQLRGNIHRLAPKLPELWEESWKRLTAFGHDPQYPYAFAFYEVLAELSTSNLLLTEAMTLRPRAERAASLEAIRRSLAWNRLRAWVCESIENLSGNILPIQVPLAAMVYADDRPPVLTTLLENAEVGFSLLLEERTLVVWLPEGSGEACMTLDLADGSRLQAERDPEAPRLTLRLPPDLPNEPLRLELRLGETSFDLPVQFR